MKDIDPDNGDIIVDKMICRTNNEYADMISRSLNTNDDSNPNREYYVKKLDNHELYLGR